MRSELIAHIKDFFHDIIESNNIRTKYDFCKYIALNLKDKHGYIASGHTAKPTEEFNSYITRHHLRYESCGNTRLCLSYKDTIAIKIDKCNPAQIYNNNHNVMYNENEKEFGYYRSIINQYPLFEICLCPPLCLVNINTDHYVSIFPYLTNHIVANPYNFDKYAFIDLFQLDMNPHNVREYHGQIFHIDYNIHNVNTLRKKTIDTFIEKFEQNYPQEIEQSRAYLHQMRSLLY